MIGSLEQVHKDEEFHRIEKLYKHFNNMKQNYSAVHRIGLGSVTDLSVTPELPFSWTLIFHVFDAVTHFMACYIKNVQNCGVQSFAEI